MKIALLTVFDENYRDVADRTLRSMRRYADTFGLELVILQPDTSDRPATWSKITRIREVLQAGFEYCFYVDADTLFVRFDEDIRNYIPAGKDLCICWHDPDNSEDYSPIQGHFNAGVMIWRNCAWSIDFLDEIWRHTDFIHHFWHEQAALIDLLGYRSQLELGVGDDPVLNRMAHVQTLPVDWNAIVGYTIGPDPIIIHAAGRSMASRLADLDRENAFQAIREIIPSNERHLLSRQLNLISFQNTQAETLQRIQAENAERLAAQRNLEVKQAETLQRIQAENAEYLVAQRNQIQALLAQIDRSERARSVRLAKAFRRFIWQKPRI